MLSALVTAIITPIIVSYITKNTARESVEEMSCGIDNAGVRIQIKEYLNHPIPYYGDSENGNVKPQMLVYIDAFNISKKPEIKKAVKEMKEEVEKRSLNNNYFTLDNDFRAKMDIFKNRLSTYANTCIW